MIEMTKEEKRNAIAKRAALELHDGFVVNLGIGIPTLCTKYLDPSVRICINGEPGIMGQGPAPSPDKADPMHTVDASGAPASVAPGGSFADSATTFGYIRGGHVDVTILGCLQCDAEGNMANWIIPGKRMPGMGGAMDLCTGARKVIVAMEHTAGGSPKIMQKCTLPLTAAKRVSKIITDLAVMEIRDGEIVLCEYSPLFSGREEAVSYIQERTDARLIIDAGLKPMDIDI